MPWQGILGTRQLTITSRFKAGINGNTFTAARSSGVGASSPAVCSASISQMHRTSLLYGLKKWSSSGHGKSKHRVAF